MFRRSYCLCLEVHIVLCLDDHIVLCLEDHIFLCLDDHIHEINNPVVNLRS